MMSSLWVFGPILSISLFFVGCGTDYQETNIKDYRLGLSGADKSFVEAFRRIVGEYNSEVGVEVLKFVDDVADANSQIVLTKGLNDRDGKVGWGQWIRATESESAAGSLFGDTPSRTNVFSMRLEFDLDYVKERMNENDVNSEKHYELRKLFYHEVGHGLQMDHDPNPQAVMYYDISGNKDFNGYVSRVRQYLADR